MNFSFHPAVDQEIVGAVVYYEGCEPTLGLDFLREIQACIQNVFDYPTLWPELEDEVRRCLVHRFPYGVLYSIEQDGIFILAVMHLHRNPDDWKRRLG